MRKALIFAILMTLVLVAVPAFGQVDPAENQVAFWCEPDDAGQKFEPVDTPFIVPEPLEGTTWTLLVLKAGSGEGANETVVNPVVGQGYSHSSGQDNSHTILCFEDEVTTTTTTTTTSTTLPSTSSTTTSVPSTTTTEPSTTTTDPGTTTSSSTSTSTTLPVTTTSAGTTSSSEASTTTTDPSTTTTTTKAPELPNTGANIAGLFIAGIGLIALGGATLVWRRKGIQ